MKAQEILNEFMKRKSELLMDQAYREAEKMVDYDAKFLLTRPLWTSADETDMSLWLDSVAKHVLDELRISVRTRMGDQYVCPYCIRSIIFDSGSCGFCHYGYEHGKCGTDTDDYSLYSDFADFCDVCSSPELHEILNQEDD